MSATGIVGAVLFFLVGFATNLPMFGDSLVDYGRWASAHHLEALREAGLQGLTYTAYMVFGVYAATVVRGRDSWSELLSRIALMAIVVRFAVELTQVSILLVPASKDVSDFGGSMAQLGSTLSSSSLFPYLLFLLAFGGAGLSSRAIPRWLSWLALGVGALQLLFFALSVIGVQPNPVFIVLAGVWYLSIPGWPLVASIAMLVSEIGARPVSETLAASAA